MKKTTYIIIGVMAFLMLLAFFAPIIFFKAV